jgi:hypothetical protein
MTIPDKYIGLTFNEAYVEHLENKINSLKSLVNLTENWCEDQENNMTDGSICISAMKDVRRTLSQT